MISPTTIIIIKITQEFEKRRFKLYLAEDKDTVHQFDITEPLTHIECWLISLSRQSPGRLLTRFSRSIDEWEDVTSHTGDKYLLESDFRE